MENILDRYYSFLDEAVRDHEALEGLVGVFAPDATVRIEAEPVHGHEAINAYYRDLTKSVLAECKTIWTTVELPDGRLKGDWVFAARLAEGQLMTAAGIEHATLNPDGLILDLHNEYTRPLA